MALSAEAAELTETCQWLTSRAAAAITASGAALRVAEGIADVYACLLRLADVIDPDPNAALAGKMIKNALKHPAKAPGSDEARAG
jgi:hypothetical protein